LLRCETRAAAPSGNDRPLHSAGAAQAAPAPEEQTAILEGAMGRFRILSLDGGGALAGVLAVALGRIHGARTPGREILGHFDLVAGNSGGSIVLTALCCNYSPQDIASFYADPATLRRMFSPRWSAVFRRIPPLRVLFPPYSAKGKFAALNDLFDHNRQAGEPAPSTRRRMRRSTSSTSPPSFGGVATGTAAWLPTTIRYSRRSSRRWRTIRHAPTTCGCSVSGRDTRCLRRRKTGPDRRSARLRRARGFSLR